MVLLGTELDEQSGRKCPGRWAAGTRGRGTLGQCLRAAGGPTAWQEGGLGTGALWPGGHFQGHGAAGYSQGEVPPAEGVSLLLSALPCRPALPPRTRPLRAGRGRGAGRSKGHTWPAVGRTSSKASTWSTERLAFLKSQLNISN